MSEQTTISPCCVTGHIHEGTPLGSTEVVHGLSTYVSKPKDAKGGKVNKIVFISDIFGIYPNAKLLADEWAGQGYEVLIPDLFESGPVSHELLNTIVPNKRVQAQATVVSKAADTAKTAAALGPWLISNREAVSKPKIEAFVKAVKEDPTTDKVGAVGFCWGGRYALILAQEDSPARVDVAIANHPSFLVNADVEPIRSVPVAIFKGTEDAMMDEKALDEVEEILKKNLGDQKLLVQRFPGAGTWLTLPSVHGFTIRGDAEGKERDDKEAANTAALKFVKQAFGGV
ncbi:dienelactone hydrolase [Papiliotrema laurentii]|uniref:Dienelactone hydrolase n=1 Tax=Papiliotrema laurentii TaxID=5418 RepID=A0AAD9L7L5_PAPLA|nr:dienelactone hydrolase [Papiliotrema laurentii]